MVFVVCLQHKGTSRLYPNVDLLAQIDAASAAGAREHFEGACFMTYWWVTDVKRKTGKKQNVVEAIKVVLSNGTTPYQFTGRESKKFKELAGYKDDYERDNIDRNPVNTIDYDD